MVEKVVDGWLKGGGWRVVEGGEGVGGWLKRWL